jgi:hypothetical protein
MHYGEKTMIKQLYDFNGPIFVCLILKTKQRRKVKNIAEILLKVALNTTSLTFYEEY